MKKKVVFGTGLVLALVLTLGIGFFLNSKNTKKDVEIDLSVAAAVIETYVEEQYNLNPLTISTGHDNQTKKITVYVFEPGMYDNVSTYSKEDYKDFMEHTRKISLDAKEVVSKLLDRNDINLSVKILNDQNTDKYLVEVVNGKIEYSIR